MGEKMYRVVKSIFGQAQPRKVALDTLYEDAKELAFHVIKCVLYLDQFPENYYHWVHDEISLWLACADSVTCKSKLKWSDYRDNLFGYFGETKADVNRVLLSFKKQHVLKTNQYPDFEIDEQLVDAIHSCMNTIIEASKPWLLSKQIHSINDWYSIMSKIL